MSERERPWVYSPRSTAARETHGRGVPTPSTARTSSHTGRPCTPRSPWMRRRRAAMLRRAMTTPATTPAKGTGHPSGDKRFKMLDAAMKRHGFASDSLLEILHQAQELFGFLADDVLIYIGRALKLPPSRVHG